MLLDEDGLGRELVSLGVESVRWKCEFYHVSTFVPPEAGWSNPEVVGPSIWVHAQAQQQQHAGTPHAHQVGSLITHQ